MKVVVTGGAGFIGSHLVERLEQNGESVTVLDDFSSGFWENLSGFGGRVVEGSILEERAVASALEGATVVYHLAAFTSAAGSVDDPAACMELNGRGLLVVLQAARDAGCSRIVFASSAAVYGNHEALPTIETLPPKPESPYALSKWDGEVYLRLLGPRWGFGSVAVRCFNVFGPRQRADSGYAAAIPAFCLNARDDRDVEIYGDGMQTRDFVYVEDLVDALCHLGRSSNYQGIYNVGYGESITIRSLAEKIVGFSGSRSQIVMKAPRAGDVRHSLASIDRLRETGWAPKIGFEEGLIRTLEAYGLRQSYGSPSS